jgi:hypothetical protein
MIGTPGSFSLIYRSSSRQRTVFPLLGVPRTCGVSEIAENIQRQNNTKTNECFMTFLYNASTVSLRKIVPADADVSEENTGMDSTHVGMRRTADEKDALQ